MKLDDLIEKYENLGYGYLDATAKVCQDIILIKISNSKFKNNITVKGGVVMHNISNSVRRATRDLDLDFIKYSLENQSIINFIKTLNDEDIKLEIIGDIKPLHHQDYNGKRVHLKLIDKYNREIETKLDIGVHKLFEFSQDDYCFDFSVIDKSVNLLINSCEQIFVEKLKSLLKVGVRTTRYKDIFDFYYLINENKLDRNKFYNCLNILIFSNNEMKENSITDIIKRLDSIFRIKKYRDNLLNPKYNWLDIDIVVAINTILNYLNSYSIVTM